MKTTLTKNEAIAQGYTSYGFKDDGYQPMLDIHDYDEHEPENRQAMLFEKECTHPIVSEKQFREEIAQLIEESWSGETGDDTSEVEDIILRMDFKETIARINSALQEKSYYKLSNINLIP